METRSVSRFAIAGAILVLLGLITGLVTGLLANPRMGVSAHLEALLNGALLIAIAGVWRRRVKLRKTEESVAISLLIFGSYANWGTTLLGAMWGTSRLTPIAGAGHFALSWQEDVVSVLLIALSAAMIIGLALVVRGLLNGRSY